MKERHGAQLDAPLLLWISNASVFVKVGGIYGWWCFIITVIVSDIP